MRPNERRARGSLHRPLEESVPQLLIERKPERFLWQPLGVLPAFSFVIWHYLRDIQSNSLHPFLNENERKFGMEKQAQARS